MAHKKREQMVEGLVDQVGMGERYLGVVWDRLNNRWDTGRRAVLNYDPGAQWHMVVQDDAILPRDFVAGVANAMDYVHEESASALYIGHVGRFLRPVRQALVGLDNPSWIRMPGLNWGVAIVVPTYQIPEMIAYCDKLRKIKNYDLRLSQWFERLRKPVWYPWPQLIDHDPGPSMVAGRGGNRHTMEFIGEDKSALHDFDPSGQIGFANITRPATQKPRNATARRRR